MLLTFLTWTSITLARMAASCSWVGQPMIVCWSRLYSTLRVETRLTNTVRMLDRTLDRKYINMLTLRNSLFYRSK